MRSVYGMWNYKCSSVEAAGKPCYLLATMEANRKMFSHLRLAVLLWSSLWMLMVPLFHVHPEADHHHGEAGHVHGGTVHMVFSPDLDGEFDNQHSVDGFGHSNSSHADLFDHPLPVL